MGELKIRDTRRRIMRKCQNEILWLQIHRMKCKQYSRIHNELPDCVISQKHYSFDVVKEAVSKHIAGEKSYVDVENSTINRWYKWFIKVQAEVERIVHKVKIEKYNEII